MISLLGESEISEDSIDLGVGFNLCRRTARSMAPPGLYSGTSTLALVTVSSRSVSLIRFELLNFGFQELIESFVSIRLLVLQLSDWVSSTGTWSSRLWRYIFIFLDLFLSDFSNQIFFLVNSLNLGHIGDV